MCEPIPNGRPNLPAFLVSCHCFSINCRNFAARDPIKNEEDSELGTVENTCPKGRTQLQTECLRTTCK